MAKKKADKPTIPDKHPGGRPTKYNAQFHPGWGEALASKGLTNPQMADKMGIAESTFIKWMAEHEEFSVAIKRGREDPDNLVEKSLFEMATGYSYNTEKALVVSDGKDIGSHVEKVSVHETIPPNPTSMIFWLKNRRPDKWRDGQTNLNLNLNKDAENLSDEEEALYRAQIDAIKGVGK